MHDPEDAVNSSWPMRLFAGLIGTLFLAYGIWCLYTGQACIFTKYTPLHRHEGLPAAFISWSDISFAGGVFRRRLCPGIKNGCSRRSPSCSSSPWY